MAPFLHADFPITGKNRSDIVAVLADLRKALEHIKLADRPSE
ncbi:Uncharacterised protein [Mycobacteroides abscessus subsp. abscessus]|nr:Uncharacterised protein [Mycobacteroides abscessus subsp. abscessus]